MCKGKSRKEKAETMKKVKSDLLERIQVFITKSPYEVQEGTRVERRLCEVQLKTT